MNILLVSEEISNDPREGLQVFLYHLVRFLDIRHRLTVAYSYGKSYDKIETVRVVSKKSLVSPGFLRLVTSAKYDINIYVPSSSLTAFGLARGLLIKLLSGRPTLVIALQERKVGLLHKALATLFKPDMVLSPSTKIINKMKEFHVEAHQITPGFDKEVFKPADEARKVELKKKLHLPLDKKIILHVGHVKESRNMELFLRYRNWGSDIQPVIKAGEVDPSWVHRLRMAGVIIIDEFMRDINEVYQAADCYLFPVFSPTGAVEFPLSCIEAAACNLPILTTRFGALERFFPEGDGLLYFEKANEIKEKISRLLRTRTNTHRLVEGFTWEEVFKRHIEPYINKLQGKSG